MALKLAHTTLSGVSINPAYVRAESFHVTKDYVSFSVAYYVSATEKIPVETRLQGAPYELNGDNPIKQSYEHLKALPEFEGAIDC
jgi:hypothetical protein